MTSWLVFNGILLLAAYLLGSIPTGYLLGRWLRGIDIREYGSGATGATNVLRTVGKLPALVSLLVDIGKGLAAIALISWAYSLPLATQLASNASIVAPWLPWMATFAGLMSLVGHSKSIWIGFSGGKSVATSFGVLLGMSSSVALGTLGFFVFAIAISRIVSLSSMTAAIGASALMVLTDQPVPYQIFAIAGGVYVLWRHRTNLYRLWTGTEPKLGQKFSTSNSQS
jgi:glycerol-3-phosphate acyltransferase PlsY